jgi:hypothetical protein
MDDFIRAPSRPAAVAPADLDLLSDRHPSLDRVSARVGRSIVGEAVLLLRPGGAIRPRNEPTNRLQDPQKVFQSPPGGLLQVL